MSVKQSLMAGAHSSSKQRPIAAASCLSPAKVNLTLWIRGRRPDGYHLIESDMVAIGVFDRLEVSVYRGARSIELSIEGRDTPVGRANLVYRAAELLLDECGVDLHVGIRLEKRIPSGAGLGGGSSDAATTLRLVNELAGTHLTDVQLEGLALQLGADVPFFVSCRPSRVSGIGEKFSPLEPWPNRPLVVAFQGVGLATSDVYAEFDRSLTSPGADSSIPVFSHLPDIHHRNDLEPVAIRMDPGVNELKQRLLASGASDVGMSGSGSAVFGFFPGEAEARSCAASFWNDGVWAEATNVLAAACPITRELVTGGR